MTSLIAGDEGVARKARQAALLEAFTGMLMHISRRPKLYTRNGGFWEVVAYVEGYFRGAGNPTGEYGYGKEDGMVLFGRWLVTRFGHPERGTWADRLLEQCSGDEHDAIRQLWPLYEEYLQDKQ
jgi:hypothetical protein